VRRWLPFLLLLAGFTLVVTVTLVTFRAPPEDTVLHEEIRSRSTDDRLRTYVSSELGLRFDYPALYHLRETDGRRAARTPRVIVLVEDTAENRDLLDGVSTTAREGPPSLTIEVHANPDGLGAEAWTLARATDVLRTGPLDAVEVAGEPGVRFAWDGLYLGRSTVVSRAGYLYVFSVTWMDPGERILADHEALLASVRWRNPDARLDR
jgi:hypothetical protein